VHSLPSGEFQEALQSIARNGQVKRIRVLELGPKRLPPRFRIHARYAQRFAFPLFASLQLLSSHRKELFLSQIPYSPNPWQNTSYT